MQTRMPTRAPVILVFADAGGGEASGDGDAGDIGGDDAGCDEGMAMLLGVTVAAEFCVLSSSFSSSSSSSES